MSKPVVFVIGATGNVGSATVQSLSARFSNKLEIRAGVRNLDKADKLKGLKGVSVVQAEMGVKDKLVEIFKGVDALYIVTPGGVLNPSQLIIDTAEAAQLAGVKHLLTITAPDDVAETILGKQFKGIEDKLSKLKMSCTFLHLPFFYENSFAFKSTIQEQSAIYSPVDPTKPFSAASVEDIGVAGAVILSNPEKHANKKYHLMSASHSYEDLATGLSEVLGKEVKYIRVPYEDTKKTLLATGLPEWQIDGLFEMYKLIDSGSKITDYEDRGTFESITGEKPTSLKTWLSKVGPAFK